MSQKPSVGRIVHYVSYGTPAGEYKSKCRAAIIAAVPEDALPVLAIGDATVVDLVVLNPTGLFFNRCHYHEGDVGTDHTGAEIEARSYQGGTWHWPERVVDIQSAVEHQREHQIMRRITGPEPLTR